MPRHPKDPLERNAVSLGLTPEVHRIVKNYHLATAAPGQSIQDTCRELIMRGGGVECDEAMLSMMRARARIVLEAFAARRCSQFFHSLADEIEVYANSMGTDEEGKLK
jgi:hypothetical protein